MYKRKTICTLTALALMSSAFTACGGEKDNGSTSVITTEPSSEVTNMDFTETSDNSITEYSSVDYLALVNKLNPLPEGWEDSLITIHMTNSLGDDVEVDKKAYEAYLRLKKDLEGEGIFVDLDSARRSIADQQRIMDDFTKEYGADYAAKTVATPGYSEHHTGLALDLYLVIDGKDVFLNEDMIQYPEIWEKIHEKLASYGFILRYLEDKEHITGYGYEPWHIRYIDNPDIADDIMSKGITLEEHLGFVPEYDVTVELNGSEEFSEEELKEAAIQIKCKFASFKGCELSSLRYAGDASNNEENLAHMNSKDEGKDYGQVIEFLSDFRTREDCTEVFEPETEIKDYQWWLAREEEGGWQLLDWGE